MDDRREDKKQNRPGGKRVGSTTSLGKRRSLKSTKRHRSTSPEFNPDASVNSNENIQQKVSTMSDPKTSDYGSQASLLRNGSKRPNGHLTKVTILGAAGGIGQPLSLLLTLYSDYIHHLALYDVAHVRGVGADLSHVDRQCKITTHLGPNELPEAVKGASVIIVLAGIAQKPGMTRDDLFTTNSKIIFDLAKACAKHAPEAHLAIVSNPVNSLVPLVYKVYKRILGGGGNGRVQKPQTDESSGIVLEKSTKSVKSVQGVATKSGKLTEMSAKQTNQQQSQQQQQQQVMTEDLADWAKRIYGVTTLDVVRASKMTAESEFFPLDSSTGLFKDPAKVNVPVVGGHAGRTIIPLLSRATPRLDKKKLEDQTITSRLVHSIQEAGIDVLNAKQGAGSATLSMAYSACRFAISLLRAQSGESNIIECAYVKHKQAVVDNLDYFSLPLLLGKNGYIKALNPLGKLMKFEEKMIEEGAKLLRASVVKGEDSAKEQLSFDKS